MPYFHLSFCYTRKIIQHTVFLFNFSLCTRKKTRIFHQRSKKKNSLWSEPVFISSLPTKYNTRHKSLKQEPFVLNFLQISYIHASHLCSPSDVPLSFPNVKPSVFWSTEMTANPIQHWGGKNHSSVSRFVTRIVLSSYRSALFALSKCNLGSISSFLICPPAAEHTLQRNMKENSRRGLKTNTKGSACLQEKAWKL